MAAARSPRRKHRFDDDGWTPSPHETSTRFRGDPDPDPDHGIGTVRVTGIGTGRRPHREPGHQDPDTDDGHDARHRGDPDHDRRGEHGPDHDPDDHQRDGADRDRDRDGRDPDRDDELDEPRWSSYRDAAKGPDPVPTWVVTDPRAIDTDHGVMKTGKEADVSLLHRQLTVDDPTGDERAGAHECWLAVKRYRSAEHRMFHRDAGYLEGRRVRRSREMRAMARRTDFGRDLIAGQWAAAEFSVLARLWQLGAAVPYPVQLIGTELMMEFIGEDGIAAPRLAQVRPSRTGAADLYDQMRTVLRQLADAGYAHGDLSPYNVLVDRGRIVLIDLPQAVDLVGNPQGFAFLRRDCENICSWFAAHGAPHADAAELHAELLRSVPGID